MKSAYFQSPGLFANPVFPPPEYSPAGHHHGCGCHKRPHYHECCPDCGRPAYACCCGSRRCHKEAKELLAESTDVAWDELSAKLTETGHRTIAAIERLMFSAYGIDVWGKTAETVNVGVASTFIGGGCCVRLSIEYMPNPSAPPPRGTASDDTALMPVLAPATGNVNVIVADKDKTVMLWGKLVDPNDGYRIQEDIITTRPGAKLTVAVFNSTARVRWCEVFSC